MTLDSLTHGPWWGHPVRRPTFIPHSLLLNAAIEVPSQLSRNGSEIPLVDISSDRWISRRWTVTSACVLGILVYIRVRNSIGYCLVLRTFYKRRRKQQVKKIQDQTVRIFFYLSICWYFLSLPNLVCKSHLISVGGLFSMNCFVFTFNDECNKKYINWCHRKPFSCTD